VLREELQRSWTGDHRRKTRNVAGMVRERCGPERGAAPRRRSRQGATPEQLLRRPDLRPAKAHFSAKRLGAPGRRFFAGSSRR
jgi:hypothetical protein